MIVETLSRLNLVRLEIEINDGGLDGKHEGMPDIRGLLSSWPGLGPMLTEIAGAGAPHVGAHTGTATRTRSRASSTDLGSNADTDSGSDTDTEQEPLSLGERTLDAIDVPAFAARLIDAIPTLEDALIQVQRPRRSLSGARLRVRTALFGRVPEGDYACKWRWVGDVLYQETEGCVE